jgi:ribosomal-protein-alanine N-acetyltransferase
MFPMKIYDCEILTFREYSSNDHDALQSLLYLNTPEYFAKEEKNDFIYYLENEVEYYYVGILGKQIVCSGGINFKNEPTAAFLSWDLVHPEFQGRGIGRALLQYRLEQLESIEGISKVIVRTSQLAWRFYEKSGFELIEVKKDHWAKGLDMYYMQLNLKRE